jgi:hypothetical protein
MTRRTIAEAREALSRTPLADSISSLEPVSLEGVEYSSLFKLTTLEGGRYSLKLRSVKDYRVANSLECLRTMRDPNRSIVGYERVFEVGDAYLLVSRWIGGLQPVRADRELIRDFFAELGRFNRQNESDGPYTSMCLDGLYLGFGCMILEDMNTGNMIRESGGTLRFLDVECLTRGLNLYQFDHVNLFRFDEERWYNITLEAKDSLSAYFSSALVPRESAVRGKGSVRLTRKCVGGRGPAASARTAKARTAKACRVRKPTIAGGDHGMLHEGRGPVPEHVRRFRPDCRHLVR